MNYRTKKKFRISRTIRIICICIYLLLRTIFKIIVRNFNILKFYLKSLSYNKIRVGELVSDHSLFIKQIFIY